MATTYRGVTLPFAKHSDNLTPRAIQNIAFPAVDGTAVKHMGRRDKSIRIKGLIADLLTGTFTKTTLEGLNDTNIGTLNINGLIYTNVRIHSCAFGRAYKDGVTDKIACTYEIEFRKLR